MSSQYGQNSVYVEFCEARLKIALSWSEKSSKIRNIKISFGRRQTKKSDSSNQSESIRLSVERFLNGKLAKLPLDYLDMKQFSVFEKDILMTLRSKVRRGATVSYSELANLAGYPGSARAVGNLMKKNPYPLFFPCHRVTRADSIGEFSGGGGVKLKRMLLKAEGLCFE
ncbi:MAG TPA: methylated-DNA--[protein]-cysteine S-methyltransferase [Victivallales bacterium]|nr:methylated-DNA--[protein]-cysteine S-methyltransferase [Victivallales bacterium]